MKPKFISQADIKWWMFLLGTVVVGVVWLVRLEGKVNAMVEREQMNKAQFIDVAKLVKETHDIVIVMEVKQGYILQELGIEVK